MCIRKLNKNKNNKIMLIEKLIIIVKLWSSFYILQNMEGKIYGSIKKKTWFDFDFFIKKWTN